MAGIPVHISSPINDSKATNSSPHITSHPSRLADGSVPKSSSSTAASVNHVATSRSGDDDLQAPPVNAASIYAASSPTRTVPSSTSTASGPPAPQPGQAPKPLISETKSTFPPPPQASVTTHIQPFPPPLQTPSVTQPNYPPPKPTSPRLMTSSYAYAQPPAGVTSTAQDLSHPPGYVQNHHASFDDSMAEQDNATQDSSSTRSHQGRGILDGISTLQAGQENENSPIWDTAMSWAKEVGKKLSDAEGDVWKKINVEK